MPSKTNGKGNAAAPRVANHSASVDSTQVDKGIDLFFSHFKNVIETISSSSCSRNEDVYKRLLFCCLIDTISDVVELPAPHSNINAKQDDKAKFLYAIRRFGEWPEHDRVSRPYLDKLLSETTDPRLDPLKEWLASLETLPNTSIVKISYDLDLKLIEKLWPKDANNQPVKINKKTFSDLRHDSLFYFFRNKLVHEMRAVNPEAYVGPNHLEPFYHRGQDETEKPFRVYWLLTHPPKVVEKLALRILKGLTEDCRQRKIDPGKRLFAEPYWSER